jgi:DNA-binding transcriptional ArsR family regulator
VGARLPPRRAQWIRAARRGPAPNAGAALARGDISTDVRIGERPENLVSHHLRALRTAGLAQSRRDGKMVMYSLTDRGRLLLEATMSEAAVRA